MCAPLLLTSSSLGCQCLGWRRLLAQERVFAQTLHSNRVGSAMTLTHRLKTPPSAAGPLLCCVGLRALVAEHPRVPPTSALWGASFDFWPRFGIPAVGNCGVEALKVTSIAWSLLSSGGGTGRAVRGSWLLLRASCSTFLGSPGEFRGDITKGHER